MVRPGGKRHRCRDRDHAGRASARPRAGNSVRRPAARRRAQRLDGHLHRRRRIDQRGVRHRLPAHRARQPQHDPATRQAVRGVDAADNRSDARGGRCRQPRRALGCHRDHHHCHRAARRPPTRSCFGRGLVEVPRARLGRRRNRAARHRARLLRFATQRRRRFVRPAMEHAGRSCPGPRPRCVACGHRVRSGRLRNESRSGAGALVDPRRVQSGAGTCCRVDVGSAVVDVDVCVAAAEGDRRHHARRRIRARPAARARRCCRWLPRRR